jgi:molybdopterin synthase sulfur carrier subunit
MRTKGEIVSAIIRIPTPLRKITNGESKINIMPGTLNETINLLENQYPGFKEKICDENGNLRSFVNIYIDGEDIRFIKGMDTEIIQNSDVSIVPAVAGG